MGTEGATLEIGVLGPLHALRGEKRLDLGPHRQKAVLAVLAVHANTVVSTERLVDQVWAGSPPESATGTLQAYVANLRRALEPGRAAREAAVLVSQAPGYVLRVGPAELDALRFERLLGAARAAATPEEELAALEEALSLWRGPALVEFDDEDFARGWRTRLQELRAGAVEQHCALLLELGRAGDAVAELATAVEEWPLRELLRVQQLVALNRMGRHGEALRAYEAARCYLADELGVSPGPDLQAAYQLILAEQDTGPTLPGLLAESTSSVDSGSVEVFPGPHVYAFLFTDVEDSTPQWEAHPTEMAVALARHDDIAHEVVARHRGRVFSNGGDGFAVVFADPYAALTAALDMQRALALEQFGSGLSVRVRMGIHAGTAEHRDASFFGVQVNRAARIAAAAHGGQLVLSQTATDLLRDNLPPDVRLVDVGEYLLKGLSRPERLFDVIADGLPAAGQRLRAQRSLEGNLPATATTFVGREQEVEQLAKQLKLHRVISIVGPGGVGKTRLALEIAHHVSGAFADGVWLCELGPVTDADVAYVVGGVLKARPAEGRAMLDAVVESLQGRRLLLVVDNCEHVLDAAAGLVSRIAAACPTVTVLVTSREPLAIQAERVWSLGGLDITIDAPALFWDRAGASDERYSSHGTDPAEVASICSHLDGMPLAIELAAARVRSMTISDLAARLDDRFQLLRSPARDRPARHHTLHAAIDWSYQLLGPDEQVLFDRLSIFPGQFGAHDATDICAYPPLETPDIERILHQLVDKSVVVVDRAQRTARFILLETLRQYAIGHLGHTARQQLEDRFVSHYVALASDGRDRFVTSARQDGYEFFRREWHNIRAALQVAVLGSKEASVTALLNAVHWYAEASGVVEVGAWAELACVHLGHRPALLGSAGFFATLRGDWDQANEFAAAGLAAANSPDDSETRLCWQTLQLVHWYGGNPAAALEAQLRVIDLTDPGNDPYGAAFAYAVAGGTAALVGRPEGQAWLAESRRIAAPLMNPTLTMWQTFMTASDALGHGQLEDALTGFQQAAEAAAACDASVWETRALAVLGRIATRLGRHDASRVCHDSLARLCVMRSWGDACSMLDTILELWVREGRMLDAALVIGFLETHKPNAHSLAGQERAKATAAVQAQPGGREAIAAAKAMSRDAIMATVLHQLAAGPE